MSKQQWFRPEILTLPAYVPGKRGESIKLSSNENPFLPLETVRDAVARCRDSLNRYPDLAATSLAEAIAEFHGWHADGVVVGNGSTALIEKILHAVVTPGGEVVMPWRSFEAYPIAVQAAGGESVKVPLTRDGAHDLAAMRSLVTPDTRAVLLCSPNNPTGVALRHAETDEFLASIPESVPVLLDEAYIDFVTAEDRVRSSELLAKYTNLIVLRTFSKAYGLAGLRVGYALAGVDMAAGIRAILTPFGVSGVAQAAAIAALSSCEEVARRCAHLVEERSKFVAALAVLDIPVPDSQANFVWLPGLGAEYEAACAAEGVTVRRFGDEGIRVSIGESEGLRRVLVAISKVRIGI